MKLLLSLTFCFLASLAVGEAFKACWGPHREWSECTNHCPNTCFNYNMPHACRPDCTKPSCVCKHGYYEDPDGCLSLKQCNEKYRKLECLAPGTEWSNCTDPCPSDCFNYNVPHACMWDCGKPSCMCAGGRVLDPYDSTKCLTIEQCQERYPNYIAPLHG